jgi:hypothetical protein
MQARLRPGARFEHVPQLWVFRADITGKWFASKSVFVHGHLAVTFPGSGVRNAPGVNAGLDPWLSARVFVRVAF